jgi:hypothetical protein
VLPPSGVVFGGAALALAGVATAIALETTRKRKEAEDQTRLEMERKNAEAEAAEAAHAAALAAARAQAGFELTMGQILNQATGGQETSEEWLARKEAMLEPQLPPAPPPLNLASWKQEDYKAGEAWEQERAYQEYRAGEHASLAIPSPVEGDSSPGQDVDVARIIGGVILIIGGLLIAGLGAFLVAAGAGESSTVVGAVLGIHVIAMGGIMFFLGVGIVALGGYLIATSGVVPGMAPP